MVFPLVCIYIHFLPLYSMWDLANMVWIKTIVIIFFFSSKHVWLCRILFTFLELPQLYNLPRPYPVLHWCHVVRQLSLMYALFVVLGFLNLVFKLGSLKRGSREKGGWMQVSFVFTCLMKGRILELRGLRFLLTILRCCSWDFYTLGSWATWVVKSSSSLDVLFISYLIYLIMLIFFYFIFNKVGDNCKQLESQVYS